MADTDMKVPKDQGLFLTVFYAISLTAILLVWTFLPPTVSHHEEEDEDQVKVLKPEEAIQRAEEALIQAEAALAEMEKSKEEKAGGGKPKGASTKGGDKK